MSAHIIDVTDRVVTLEVTGQLRQPELAAAQQRVAEIIQQRGEIRLLVQAGNFTGFDPGGDWGDLSFQAQYDPFIQKIAIVADKKWEDLTLMFTGKGIRRVPIEYFEPASLLKAKAWLSA
jgi:hypothetical protein